MRIASRRHGHCWVQRDAASAGTHRFNASNERDANKSPGSDQKKETSLLDSLPEANLHAGIRFDSLQRAVAKREIADPNLSFALNAAPAPLCYGYGDQIVWKTWESPNLHYNPLYFEEEGLERYGHHRGDHLQHYVSGIHFFTGVLMLPYKMAVQHPRECEFGLGYYRPGNCNPAYQRGVDHSLRGTAAQGLFIGGLLAL